MNTLLKGVYLWRKTDEAYLDFENKEIIDKYIEKVEKSKTVIKKDLVWTYSTLLTYFGLIDNIESDDIFYIQEREIWFFPLRVKNPYACQKNIFNSLRLYCENNDVIDILHLNILDLTAQSIKTTTEEATVNDVKKGLQIWETLPCRIKKINVYEPNNMSTVLWTTKKLMPVFLNKKVAEKLNFIKSDLPFSKQGQ